MRFCGRHCAIFLLASVVTITLAYGQDDRVKRISGETADGIHFTTWTETFVFQMGQDIVINYEVRNRGSKPAYLVLKDGPPDVRVEEGIHTLFIEAPVPADPHGTFNYSFIRILKGNSHRGRFVIPHSIYKAAAYWEVVVGFGYVFDVSGLEKKSGDKDDPGSRLLLRSRLGQLGLGYLSIEVKKP